MSPGRPGSAGSAAASSTTMWEALRTAGIWIPWRNAPLASAHRPRILFVSHEATRTGAPLILHTLLRHFARVNHYELFVLCDRPGPMMESFCDHAHVIDGSRLRLLAGSATVDDFLRGFQTELPILAICNTSTVNRYALACQRFGVPVITLVHEILARTDANRLREIYQASERIVFPAEFVRDAAHRVAVLPTGKAVVISQGLLDPDFGNFGRDEARAKVLREIGASTDPFLVVGCGTIDLRKGADLFVDVAEQTRQIAPDASIQFVWLGGDPLYQAQWIRKDVSVRGLQDSVHFVGEHDSSAPFFRAADAFVLTSREDPSPCVVYEAMVSEAPVIAFADAGGAPAVLEGGCGIVVPFLNVRAMADAIVSLYGDPQLADRIARLAKIRVLTKYRFDDYYNGIIGIARAQIRVALEPRAPDDLALLNSAENRDQEKRDFDLIRNDGDFDPDFFLPSSASDLSRDEAIKCFMQNCSIAGGDRKPFSGFNHKTYSEHQMTPQELERRNPLAHFIEKGKPFGPWLVRLIREPVEHPDATRLRMALHLHAFYPELVEELLQYLDANRSRCDLFVSTTSAAHREVLENVLEGYERGDVEISILPNRGRDIGAFLAGYRWNPADYDLVGHLHCKKTPQYDPEIGSAWRAFLWRNLIGKEFPMMDVIAHQFEADPRLGLVFPDDPYPVGWTSNIEFVERLARKLHLATALPQNFEFPVGTMFWARPMALRPLFALELNWDDFPPEPLPTDGTILHAIERVLPFVVEQQGFLIAATHVAGLTR